MKAVVIETCIYHIDVTDENEITALIRDDAAGGARVTDLLETRAKLQHVARTIEKMPE